MSRKISKKRSVATAPLLRVSCDDVAIETQADSFSRECFDNGENVPSRKVSREMTSPSRKLSSTRPGLSPKSSSLAVTLEKRRGSTVSRSHFLRSFGQTDLRFHNIDRDEEEILHRTPSEVNMEYGEETSKEKEKSSRPAQIPRAVSAGPVLHARPLKSQTLENFCWKNILDIRGSEYPGDAVDLDIKTRLRKQSAKRRIRRITKADRERREKEAEQEQETQKEEPKKRFTFRGATLAVMMLRGPGNDSVQERKKMLAAKRIASKNIARTKFRWAARVVRVLCRILRIMAANSVELTPQTAAQNSWYSVSHSTAAKEIMFNKSLYQRGKSQYAYVPEVAKKILNKAPMDRTENELGQLHAMLRGLDAYEKFTYRIQLAMCRAMTYLKVTEPRVVLRKGHAGVGFYFIFSGSVFVNVEELLKRTGHVMWHTFGTLERGDSFGELALLRKIKRTASVIVREDVELLVVDKDVFSITCPRIYDKELITKIKFCKSLPLFQAWSEEALRNICFEAQIQEWKANKVVVKDGSKETEWIYLCMKGKCSVIKALELRQAGQIYRPRRMTFEELFLAMGAAGRRKSRSVSDPSRVWRRELQKSLKEDYSFTSDKKKIDETPEEMEKFVNSDSESEEEEQMSGESSGKMREEIIEVMSLSYADMPHAKGDSQFCVMEEDKEQEREQKEDETAPLELERRERPTDNFSELIRMDAKAGKLNKDVVYLDVACMKTGDVFDIVEVLQPKGRKLMLVSCGTVLLKIKRADFFRFSTKASLTHARRIAKTLDYPSDEILYKSYNTKCTWERFKSKQLQLTMHEVKNTCIRHVTRASQPTTVTATQTISRARRPDEEKLRLQKREELLAFVYGSHKAEHESNLDTWTMSQRGMHPIDLLATKSRKSSLGKKTHSQRKVAHTVNFDLPKNHRSKRKQTAQRLVAT